MRRHLWMAWAALSAGVASAQPVGQGFYGSSVLTPGPEFQGCGNWIEYRRTPNHPGEQIMKSWIWGYMSGIGSGSPIYSKVTLPNGTTISAWMDKYCAENPLSNVIAGSTQLLRDLAPTKSK